MNGNMTVAERIIQELTIFPGLDDDELAKHLKKDRHHINKCCREMADKGVLQRNENPGKNNKICNYLKDDTVIHTVENQTRAQAHSDGSVELQEEDIKQIINDWLIADGWKTTVAWKYSHGVDIEGVKDGKRWLIEVKGPGSRNEMRVNYFIGILGETLQRMDDENARYSIAFPDMDQFRRLWDKLPSLAKKRTTIDMLLVSKDGTIELLR